MITMQTITNKITIEQLKEIIDFGCSLSLLNDGQLCEIEPNLYFIMSKDVRDFQRKGFTVTFTNSGLKRKCLRFDTLITYLKKQKIIKNNTMELGMISNRWRSFEDFTEYKKIIALTMDEILLRYKDADTFSLTGVYNDGFSEKYPHGIYSVDEQSAKRALENVYKRSMDMLKDQYAFFTEEEKQMLPAFETLVNEIQKECDEYFARVESGKIPEGQSPFLADLIYEGKTRYTEPRGVWHFYHELYSRHIHFKKAIAEMQKNKEYRNTNEIFETPYYKELKECLIDTEITFTWHCTTSGRLAVVYYFKINETSLQWLRRLKNDYDMRELEDLAFYKDSTVVFSSCTHEGYHTENNDNTKMFL